MWVELAMLVGGSIISRETSKDAAKREIAAARNERDDHFVNLRKSAERAGFNPLTALRATGGGGYGQYVPLLSRSAVGEGNRAMGQYAANAMRDYAFASMNQAHETKLNRMNNDAMDARQTREIASRPKQKAEFDYSTVKTVPVKFGNKSLDLDATVARRLRIEPGDLLMPGELAEIGGEFWGEIISAIGTEAAAEILGVDITVLLNGDKPKSTTIGTRELPSLDTIEIWNSDWYKTAVNALSRAYTQPTFEEQAQGWANESAKHARAYAK